MNSLVSSGSLNWDIQTYTLRHRELNPELCDSLEGWDGGGGTDVHLGLILVARWQKPTRQCKALILQLKINLFLKSKHLRKGSSNLVIQIFRPVSWSKLGPDIKSKHLKSFLFGANVKQASNVVLLAAALLSQPDLPPPSTTLLMAVCDSLRVKVRQEETRKVPAWNGYYHCAWAAGRHMC